LDDVFLNIYDSEGRAVRTLVNKKQPMGEYSVVWDGKDDNGQSIASGQFYYQLKVGSFISTKKVIAVK
jgi:flagellar hook assembly protein FlgD